MQCAYTVLHCHLWRVWLYLIFPRYLINGTIFEKNVVENKMRVLIFPSTFVENFYHSQKT